MTRTDIEIIRQGKIAKVVNKAANCAYFFMRTHTIKGTMFSERFKFQPIPYLVHL